jgi:hypothetical protein
MPNYATQVAPSATLSVSATIAPAYLGEPDSPLVPVSRRVNYVVRNLGPGDWPGFDVILLLGDCPLDRHSYPTGLDAGRALASYFRVSSPFVDDGPTALFVRVESRNPAACCHAVVAR